MLALKKSKLPLTDYKKHWKYKMSQVTQWEHQEFYLVGGDKLHFPLLLYTGDQCIKDLQQWKFVLDITSDCWINISYSMQ